MDLGDLPFDMPKLNRRLRAQSGLSSDAGAPSTLDPNNMSHASSSLSMRGDDRMGTLKFILISSYLIYKLLIK